jgi:hypothetical protein
MQREQLNAVGTTVAMCLATALALALWVLWLRLDVAL